VKHINPLALLMKGGRADMQKTARKDWTLTNQFLNHEIAPPLFPFNYFRKVEALSPAEPSYTTQQNHSARPPKHLIQRLGTQNYAFPNL